MPSTTPGKYHDAVRDRAGYYYCIQQKDIPTVAQLTGVAQSTLYRWRKEDDWEDRRAPAVLSGREARRAYERDIQGIRESAREEGRALNASEADAITKLQSAAEKADPKSIRRAHYLDCVADLGIFLAAETPELYQDLITHLNEFARRTTEAPVI